MLESFSYCFIFQNQFNIFDNKILLAFDLLRDLLLWITMTVYKRTESGPGCNENQAKMNEIQSNDVVTDIHST